MKITEDVRKFAAENGLAEEAALQAGMAEKSREFVATGSEIYHAPGSPAVSVAGATAAS